MDEEFPRGAPAGVASTAPRAAPQSRAVARESIAAPVEASNSAPSQDTPAGLAALGSGQFGVVDAIHRGEGTATLYRLSDGQHVLRFEDFRVTNGPDLYVYLSGHDAPRDSRQLHEAGAVEVARLKGNVGSQNYELPAAFDPAAFRSAVIYCRRFATVFSTTELTAN